MPKLTSKARLRITLVVFSLLTAVIIFVAPIPILMGILTDEQIARLSNLGQSYGIVSAFLSSAALVGVVASVFYQATQTRIQGVATWRSAHTDLLKMVMEDPALYGPCIGTRQPGIGDDSYRQ